MKNAGFRERLGFALSGVREGWRRERSFRTQTACAALALGALMALRPGLLWWAVFMVVVATVLALELINGALEALIDHLHPENHPEVRIVKDMAAGSVLLASLAAAALAVLLVIDRLVHW